MATEVSVRGLQLVDPTGKDMGPGEFHLARRPRDLKGSILGLLENGRPASATLLKELGAILNQEYEFKEMLYFSKENSTLPTKPELVSEILEKCDFLVVGVGD